MKKLLLHIGRYYSLMREAFRKPENYSVYFQQTLKEIDAIGIQSLGIILIISVFMGAVVVIQTANNLDSPLTPVYLIGFTARQSVILEFSSTVLCLILSGKVGSRIASEIGTMRVTEQIDALEVMGVNAPSYLILPKIAAAVFIMPFLVIISMFFAITGGYLLGMSLDLISSADFIYGLKLDFKPFDIFYSIFKSLFFAFAISSISSYHGYYAYGGALDVGKASTKAVVFSMIAILVMNYILTQLLLS